MSPLEELVQAASGDSVSVSTLLRKLKVVATRLGTTPLDEWVDHELMGYPCDTELPNYRATRTAQVQGTFTGSFGSVLRNALVPRGNFPPGWEELFMISFPQAMAEVELWAATDGPMRFPWPADAISSANYLISEGELTLYPDMYLQEAGRTLTPGMFVKIVDSVRTRILDLALSIQVVEPLAG